jgi:hypothetical protein
VSIRIGNTFCDTDREALAQLVRLARQLTPSWQRPEAFHLAKSELCAGLTALERVAYRAPRELRVIRPLNGTIGGYTAPAAAAAEAVFQPAVAASEPSRAAVSSRPARRRRWRYPQPPRRLAAQGVLL